MNGKTVVITGASSGIGKITAHELARKGARIVMVVRNRDKGQGVIDEIVRAVPDAQLELAIADLYSLGDVRRAGAEIRGKHPKIDVLVNNAGLIHDKRELTVDGFERTFALNHLAPFVLTYELLGSLAAAAPARIVTVSSEGHKFSRIDWNQLATASDWKLATLTYGNSKLCNIWFARESARRLVTARITSNALHPGPVATGFGQSGSIIYRLGTKLAKPFLLTPEEGARTQIYLASSPDVEGVTGEYFIKCRIAKPSSAARDDASARRLWELSEKLTGVSY
ncbi:MAG TPA: SDR family oxidoreductase [Kofleriaceae bacterium]|nr:SDR family oxidoreductase [Kofleriaceae bacterium]